jgi:hypothetical protein
MGILRLVRELLMNPRYFLKADEDDRCVLCKWAPWKRVLGLILRLQL